MSRDARVRAGPPGAAVPPHGEGFDGQTVRQRLDETSRLDLSTLRNEDEDGSLGPVDEGEPVLISVRGPNAGTWYPLGTGPVTVGRNQDSDVQLDDVTVSRRHAQLRRTGDRFTVADLGSLNGTYVNQERVESALLEDNDEIQIGRFRLVFRAGA